MTTVVTVSTGVGTQYGRLSAYDRAAAVSITGLASEFYGEAVTGELTTADGATALAPIATGTVSAAGAVTLTFDLDTAAMATLMAGRTGDADTVLTVYATGTESNACVATLKLSQAADHGTTTTATDATPASLLEAQALVDAVITKTGASNGQVALYDATLGYFKPGSVVGTGDVVGPSSATNGRPALFDGVTGKLLKQHTAALGGAAILNVGTAAGTVAAGNDSRLSDARTPTAHAASHATGQSDELTAADIGAAAEGHNHDTEYDALGSAAAAQAAAIAASTPVAHASETTTAHGGIVASGDSRLSDARTPTAHAASHKTGQSDVLAAADIGAEPAQTAASQAEMEAGTESAIRSVSPLRVAQAIAALAGGGGVEGSTGSVDNAALRANGTEGATVQASDLSIEDAATTTQNNVGISNQHAGQTNSYIRLAPKGTGGLILGPAPDGTATGGNARGAKAVDLQLERSSAAKIASGYGSFVAGAENTASGGNAVAVGYNNVASGLRSFVAGVGSTASSEGAVALGDGDTASGCNAIALGAKCAIAIRGWLALGQVNASNQGISQQMVGQLVNASSSTDATTLLAYGTRPTIPAGKTWLVEVWVVGAQADGSSGWGMYRACLKRVGTTTALVGSAVEVVAFSGDAGLGSPTITVSADDTNEALSVAVTPANATATKWSAAVWALQVNH